MKIKSTLAILSLSTALFTSSAIAAPYHAYEVLNDLSAEQVTALKQLGRMPSNDVGFIYESSVARILTPAQNDQYQQLKYGQSAAKSNSTDYKFNMDSK